MSVQIFKKAFPVEELYDLLDVLCKKEGMLYSGWLFNKEAYKRGMMGKRIEHFIDKCKPYYHVSKRKIYLDRNTSYKGFTTVLRQICNLHLILFETKCKYSKSQYEIIYYIHDERGDQIIPFVSSKEDEQVSMEEEVNSEKDEKEYQEKEYQEKD